MTENPTVRDMLNAFFYRKRIFILAFICLLLAGILVTMSSVTLYKSTGSLLVKFGEDADANVNGANKRDNGQSVDRREVMQSNIDILQSRDLLRAVIEKVGLDRAYPDAANSVSADSPINSAVAIMKRKHLTIKSGAQSNLINIEILNQDPKVAAQLVAAVQDLFVTKQMEIFNKPQTAFLEEQVKLAKEHLNKSQKSLREFKETAKISSIEAELSELLKQKSSAASVAFQSIDDIQTKIAELRDRETEMLATYRSDSPALKSIRKSIAEAKKQLKERQDALESPEDSDLAKQNAGIDKRIFELEEQRGEYNDLVQKVQVDEANYRTYLTKQEEARIAENLGEQKITRISIVDSPSIPVRPSSPRTKLILVASILAGIFVGGILILVAEIFDDSFRSPEQLAAGLKLPVLTALPKRDGILHLFNNLENILCDNPHKIVQITTCYDGVKASAVAKELANTAASRGKPVLLIDDENSRKNFLQLKDDFAAKSAESLTIVVSGGLLGNEQSQSIAKFVDGTVLIAEAEKTRAPVAKEAIRLVSAAGGKIIGTILTDRKFYIPQKLYNLLYKN